MTSPYRFTRRRMMARVAIGSLAVGYHTMGAPRTQLHLEAGEGRVDITPPVGTLLSGFHYRPGRERLSKGARRRSIARAIVLKCRDTMSAIVSLDFAAVSQEMAQHVGRAVEARTGIPFANVRLCATHTHSAPTGRFARQWGGLPKEHVASVENKVVSAVVKAVADLAPARLSVGTTVTNKANFNRTTKQWKTEDQFDHSASDDERWLDRELHVLRFERKSPHEALLWYHFSAHPVCFTGRLSGPDWPGVVTESWTKSKRAPCFLQGHCGDVNPGDGSRWLGNADDTGRKVVSAIGDAMHQAQVVDVDRVSIDQCELKLPLDLEEHRRQLDAYRADPEKNSSGEFVDAPFAEAWFKSMSQWESSKHQLSIAVSAIQLGELQLFFHPSELFSYYGLKIRHESQATHTIVVGYTDGFIGYLTDPTSHKQREYAAAVVPKALDLPPYEPTAARSFVREAISFANDLVKT